MQNPGQQPMPDSPTYVPSAHLSGDLGVPISFSAGEITGRYVEVPPSIHLAANAASTAFNMAAITTAGITGGAPGSIAGLLDHKSNGSGDVVQVDVDTAHATPFKGGTYVATATATIYTIID